MTEKPLRSTLRLESYFRAMRMLRKAVEQVVPLDADELTLEEEALTPTVRISLRAWLEIAEEYKTSKAQVIQNSSL